MRGPNAGRRRARLAAFEDDAAEIKFDILCLEDIGGRIRYEAEDALIA